MKVYKSDYLNDGKLGVGFNAVIRFGARLTNFFYSIGAYHPSTKQTGMMFCNSDFNVWDYYRPVLQKIATRYE